VARNRDHRGGRVRGRNGRQRALPAERWLAATFWNGLGVSDDEQGVRVFVATGLRSSWARAWPAFRECG